MECKKNLLTSYLVTDNIGLVHLCAKRFKNKGTEYEDLVSAGNIGLVKASQSFDMDKGFKFSTYAVTVILGEMRTLFRDGGSVKVSRSLKDLNFKINLVRENYVKEHGTEPSISSICEVLKISAEELAEAINASASPVSLTESKEDGNNNVIDLPVPSEDEKVSEIMALKQEVKKLQKEDRAIVELRYFRHHTQTETAKILGITQVKVSRREKVILKTLKERLVC